MPEQYYIKMQSLILKQFFKRIIVATSGNKVYT